MAEAMQHQISSGARCMVVEAGDVARVIVPGPGATTAPAVVVGARCSKCDTVLKDNSGGNASERRFVDGRLVCERCSSFFEPIGFEPRFHICINPLCRRKWKQLSAKVLPLFCPPCRRQLEEGIPDWRQLSERALMERMYQRWYAIASELAATVGCQAPVLATGQATHGQGVGGDGRDCQESSEQAARAQWRDVLDAFQSSFQQPPPVDEVRNWNSVHGRRKHYRGKVRRRERQFICSIEAEMELDGELNTRKALPPDYRDFHVLDWNNQLEDGQEVEFIAFPNPAVSERGVVSRVVRLLSAPKVVAGLVGTTGGLDLIKEESPEHARESGLPAFADLMEWSHEDAAAPRISPEIIAGRRRLSLEDALPIEQAEPATIVQRPAPRTSADTLLNRSAPKLQASADTLLQRPPPKASLDTLLHRSLPKDAAAKPLQRPPPETPAEVSAESLALASSSAASPPPATSDTGNSEGGSGDPAGDDALPQEPQQPLAEPSGPAEVGTGASTPAAEPPSNGTESTATETNVTEPSRPPATMRRPPVPAAKGGIASVTAMGLAAKAKPPRMEKKKAKVKPPPMQPPLMSTPAGNLQMGRTPSTPFPRSPYAAYFGD